MFEVEYLFVVVVVVFYGYLLFYNGSYGGCYYGVEVVGVCFVLVGGDCNMLFLDYEVFK